MKQKNSLPFINTGTAMLMTVFFALCLATFALLSLSAANSSASLSEKTAAHRTDYYAAANTSEEILARIDALLQKNRPADFDTAEKLLKKENFGTELTFNAANSAVTWVLPVGEDLVLETAVRIEGGKKLTVLSRKTAAADEWEGDTSLPVLIFDE